MNDSGQLSNTNRNGSRDAETRVAAPDAHIENKSDLIFALGMMSNPI